LFLKQEGKVVLLAYNKILTIRSPGHIKTATNYAMNIEKTTDEKQILDVISGYVTNGEKTELQGDRNVTGINCFPETAVEKMKATKKLFGKSDKRLAYQIIQSFAPGEITPALAHEFGVKYAEAWLGDFEVVIGTHLDRAHIHNHIVFNSVSCIDGRKFHLSKAEFYKKLRGISDQLCREYGLSVIEYIDSSRMSYDEWKKRYPDGRRSLKQIIRLDIEDCIQDAGSAGNFYVLMENRGYEVDLSGKYAKVRPTESERFFRLATLGYPDEELQWMIENRGAVSLPKISRVYRSLNKKTAPGRKLTRFEAMYIRWLYVLGKVKRNSWKSGLIPFDEYRKFDLYKQQLKFIAENHITNMSDLLKKKEVVQASVKVLNVEKFKLQGVARKYKVLFEAHKVFERYAPIADKLDEEQKEMFLHAKEVMRKKGFENSADIIRHKRMEMMETAARNRKELKTLRDRLKLLSGIEASVGRIKEYISKEADERWKVKRRDFYSKEHR